MFLLHDLHQLQEILDRADYIVITYSFKIIFLN